MSKQGSGLGEATSVDLGVAMTLPRWRTVDARLVAYRVALVALVLLGVYFRSRRYWFDPLGLWLDESSWARRMLTRSLFNLEFRPIGYMGLSKLLVLPYCDERTVRLLSYLPSLASLAVVVDLSRRLFASRLVRVLCVATVALHPVLIDMAREFKPYALEFFVHLSLIWLFVRWYDKRSRTRFATLLGCATLAFPFAYNVVFLLPALFGVLGFLLWRARAWRALAAWAGSALLALGLIAAVYFAALRSTASDTDGAEQFWGDKYRVFYRPTAEPAPFARARWTVEKYANLAGFPSGLGIASEEALAPQLEDRLTGPASLVWLAFHLVGLVAGWRHRRWRVFLLAGPLLTAMLFNRFGYWPFGVFRTNVFLLAYVVLIPMVGLDWLLAQRRVVAGAASAVACALVLCSSLTFGRDLHERKHNMSTQSEISTLLERIRTIHRQQPAEDRQERAYVLLDNYSCSPFQFFLNHDQRADPALLEFVNQNVDYRCSRGAGGAASALRQSPGKLFFVVTSSERFASQYDSSLAQNASTLVKENIRDSHQLYFVRSNRRRR